MIEDDDWKFDSCDGINYLFDDIDDILLCVTFNYSELSRNIKQADMKHLQCGSSLTLRYHTNLCKSSRIT